MTSAGQRAGDASDPRRAHRARRRGGTPAGAAEVRA